MEESIYVDILLISNYIIDYILLLITQKLCGRRVSRRRLALAALVAAFSSLVIFLPYIGVGWEIAVRIIVSAVVLLVGFGFVSKRRFMWEMFIFFTVNFLCAGLLLAVFVVANPKGMFYYNGVVYFDISVLVLIVNIAIAYFGITLFETFIKKTSVDNGEYKVEVSVFEKRCIFSAIVDSGNKLREPFSGTAAIVVGFDDISPYLPDALNCYILEQGWGRVSDEYMLPPDIQNKLRIIPCGHIGGDEFLPAVRGERLLITDKNKSSQRICEDFYIAISRRKIGNDEYNMLLSPYLSVNSIENNSIYKVKNKL